VLRPNVKKIPGLGPDPVTSHADFLTASKNFAVTRTRRGDVRAHVRAGLACKILLRKGEEESPPAAGAGGREVQFSALVGDGGKTQLFTLRQRGGIDG
jgi:hypothetical protein